ncbi:serine protease inhibitor 3-like [Leptopilina boulardi]|uniref:serine protease inhibitor 3-like n=1 Tax=Leptopilina boulardi TaxID=63433 RepID=UPI0021F527B1|nr:serine protease inhibitor 3-like [Leptopilina boulardi]
MKFLALFVFVVFALALVTASGCGMRCKPGSRFKQDCNECVCSDDGMTAMCTLMACPPLGNNRQRPFYQSKIGKL